MRPTFRIRCSQMMDLVVVDAQFLKRPIDCLSNLILMPTICRTKTITGQSKSYRKYNEQINQ